MKISAKGMSKRLGYEKEEMLDRRFISYKKKYKSSVYCITFDLINKTYKANYYDSKGEHRTQILGIKEWMAIQKQFDESGGKFTYER
jgi:hypothetical protein